MALGSKSLEKNAEMQEKWPYTHIPEGLPTTKDDTETWKDDKFVTIPLIPIFCPQL